MTTVQITLPDDLAQTAAQAGLLSPEAVEMMLREQLRLRAGEAIKTLWKGLPHEPLTPEIEQKISDEVRAVRARQRRNQAS
jgi:hypothetical protein